MTSPAEFHGWLGHDNKAAQGNLIWSSFKPKSFNPIDVDIKILACGICGSDIHTLRSGWGATHYPACVGHEIVGHVVRVGDKVTNIKLGDRVGVGAQAFSCLRNDCEECSNGLEQHCTKMVGTYNAKYPDGSWSMGGYADYIRVPAHFAIKIPASLKSEDAAPMMCGGITVFAPLRNNGAGPGKKVGIVGLGGLGHFGIIFAKALGCEKVVAISRRRNKVEDAKAMGATDYIATSEDDKWARKHARSLDLIISTVSSPDMPLESYLRLLRTNGTFIQVGAPEDKLPPIAAFGLIGKGCKIGGSQIGSPKDIEYMLHFAAEKGVKPWVQQRSMKEANKCVVDMEDGHARYRYVLVNPDHEGRAKI
ncbi:alcohol dehydrogenase-like protein [Cucurbitaria berberidis CBS 394.84]|uniref:alcohol dehydrogenase (NADP(+)) n=1 Tax=Cucurbitaria berberidis CBS 394.84 TaxID=1168544 RepID=A0A9P4GCP9_9PLEO|nr:alcohol dehydrogenase-like protein [Cucurbitaria berberidis CBS 394.84]KAF1842829.1 alcohol dehydrogenase-like protein [Cucurbitaria berberidis CBS 394.84]